MIWDGYCVFIPTARDLARNPDVPAHRFFASREFQLPLTRHSLPHPLTECKREMIIAYVILVASIVVTVGLVVWSAWLSFRDRSTGSTVAIAEDRSYHGHSWDFADYGISLDGTTTIARLPCGALVCRLDYEAPVAILALCSPLATDLDIARDGDAALICVNRCPCFSSCPLIKKYINAGDARDVEILFKGLVDKFKAGDGDGDLPDVGNRNGDKQSVASVPVNVRFAAINLRDDLHFVVPPMAQVVDERDNCGRPSREGGDAHERIDDDLVKPHGGNPTTTFNERQS